MRCGWMFELREAGVWRPSRAVLLFLLIIGAPTDFASAGFLEEIFGGDQTEARPAHASAVRAQASRRRAGRISFNLRLNDAPKKSRAVARTHGANSRGRAAVAEAESAKAKENGAPFKMARPALCYADAKTEAAADRADALFHDKTLRAGESIVTAEGVRIFRGRAACPHKPGEFVSLAAASWLSKTKRNALLALERAMRTAPHRVFAVSAASDATIATQDLEP
jgi:hypothetical protein